MRRITQTFCLLALLVITGNVHGVKYLDADNISQALSMVATEGSSIEKRRRFCASLLPEAKQKIDYISYNWIHRNEQEMLALKAYQQNLPEAFARMEKIADTAADAGLALFMKRKDAANICAALLRKTHDGDMDVAKKTPKAAQLLADYLKQNPLTSENLQQHHDISGCLAHGFNKDFDHDFMIGFCPCIIEVQSTLLNEQERQGMQDAFKNKQDMSSLPQLVKLKPAYETCSQKALQALEDDPEMLLNWGK